MRLGKKLASLSIAVILSVGLLPASSLAATGDCSLTAGTRLTTQDESDANGNPYPKYNDYEGGQIACTWYVWDYVYRNLGIRLPGTWGQGGSWGDAKSWYARADADPAYVVGSEPRANSIAVYGATQSNYYGHVEFVTVANGSSMTVNTGGYAGDAKWPNPPGIREGWEKTGIIGQNSLIGFIYLVQDNPITVSAADKSLKASSVKSAAKKVSPFAVADAVGAVTFSDAGSSKSLTIASDGKVAVKKGTPAGTYTAKATVKAAGDDRYKEKTVSVQAKVQVVSPPASPNALTFKTSPLPAGFKASWSKAKRASGYEIAYASAKDSAKGWRIAAVGNVSTAKVTGLKQGALYTVKIRSFAEAVDGKKYYSGWGAVSNVKTKANTYKVSFMANGGKGTMKPQTIARNKSTALNANKFTRSGYKFAGWNTKKNGKGKSYKNKAKVKNLAKTGKSTTLYAQWEKTASYTIKTTAYTITVPKAWRGKVEWDFATDKSYSGKSLKCASFYLKGHKGDRKYLLAAIGIPTGGGFGYSQQVYFFRHKTDPNTFFCLFGLLTPYRVWEGKQYPGWADMASVSARDQKQLLKLTTGGKVTYASAIRNYSANLSTGD